MKKGRWLRTSVFQTKGSERMILVRDVFQAKYGKGGELHDATGRIWPPGVL